MITNLVTNLKGIKIDEDAKGLFAFFKKKVDKLQLLKTKYDEVSKNVSFVQDFLDKHRLTLLKDISILDKMYDLNEEYYKELSMYIGAGYQRLRYIKNVELVELEREAKEKNSQSLAQKVNDLKNRINRFEKKLYDLELSKAICLQTAPQIRMVQASDEIMAEKIQSTILNTIPLWKSQMVISLGAEHSLQATKTQEAVTDFTNTLLKDNADKLKMATVEVARATERGILDIETIEYTNEKLIETLIEVRDIQREGKKNREEYRVMLHKTEEELKNRLIDASMK